MDVAMRTQMNRRLKEAQQQMLQESKFVANAKVRDTANDTKMEKAIAKQRLDASRRQEEGKAYQMK